MAISDVIHAVGRPIISHALDELLADYGDQGFQVRIWDGTTWGSVEKPRFVLVLNSPEGLRRLLSSPTEVSLGEAFVAGELDVEGDLEAAFELGDYLLSRKGSPGISQSLLSFLSKVSLHKEPGCEIRDPHLNGPTHSRRRDRQAIRYHYDLPPEFFGLWLDPYMMYSSAYFSDETDDLDEAQERKLEYICRKLRLQPEIMCWMLAAGGAVSASMRRRITTSMCRELRSACGKQKQHANAFTLQVSITNAGSTCATIEISSRLIRSTKS